MFSWEPLPAIARHRSRPNSSLPLGGRAMFECADCCSLNCVGSNDDLESAIATNSSILIKVDLKEITTGDDSSLTATDIDQNNPSSTTPSSMYSSSTIDNSSRLSRGRQDSPATPVVLKRSPQQQIQQPPQTQAEDQIDIEEEFERKENVQTDNLTQLVSAPEINIKPIIMDSLAERDYDVEPTHLYTALQRKKWSDAVSILEQAPDEARTWVYRKEPHGVKIRWRLLPIHGAIIFQAPAEVVESILLIFPESAAERDDEGSLPIHLAYKRAASAAVCKLLLDAFPSSIEIADRKGRTPKHLAASASGPKHREFVYAMKNHLLALRAARVAARAEERVKFNAKLDTHKKEHDDKLAQIEKKKAEDMAVLDGKIDELEKELRRTQQASQVLVEHVTTMEAKIVKHEATERHMSGKVETLEGDLSTAAKEREDYETQMKEEVAGLNKELTDIQEHVSHLLLEKEVLNKSLDQVVAGAELEKKALEESLAAKEEEISRLKLEQEKVYADNVLLKAEIKEKMDANESLNKKIETLEIQLRNQEDSADEAAKVAQARLEELEKDRVELRMTVGTLTQKLRTVAGFLDDMSSEQDAIIDQADIHEAEMQAAAKEHARILDQVQKQEQLDVKAQEARDIIATLMRAHEETYAGHTNNRQHIVDSIDAHSQNLVDGAERRQELVTNVKALQEKIRLTRERVLGGLPELEVKAQNSSKLPPATSRSREEGEAKPGTDGDMTCLSEVETYASQDRQEDESRYPQEEHEGRFDERGEQAPDEVRQSESGGGTSIADEVRESEFAGMRMSTTPAIDDHATFVKPAVEPQQQDQQPPTQESQRLSVEEFEDEKKMADEENANANASGDANTGLRLFAAFV